jgi:hypothetical protein
MINRTVNIASRGKKSKREEGLRNKDCGAEQKTAIRNYKKRKEFNGMCKGEPFALILLAKKELPTCYTI